MSLHKYAEFQVLAAHIAREGQPLMRTAHRHAFSYEPKPGYLYVRSRAISSRCNDNFDEFPAEEIKQAYRTFIGKPVFVNHHNSDHRRARGVIIDAALHEDTNPDGTPDTWAEVLMEVDAIRFPRLAEAVVRGDIARTSMGTDVKYSTCTACGNKAYTPADYCQHIPKMKGMRITRTTASGSKESVLIAERCYGLGFFENSLLVEDPADPTAYTFGVDTSGLVGTTAEHLAKQAAVEARHVTSTMCRECNPGMGMSDLCSPHAYRAKIEAQWGPGYQGDVIEQGPHPDQVLFPRYTSSLNDITVEAMAEAEAMLREAVTWQDIKDAIIGPPDPRNQCELCRAPFRWMGEEKGWRCPNGHNTSPASSPRAYASVQAKTDNWTADTKPTEFGLQYDPKDEHDAGVERARNWNGWASLPVTKVKVSDLHATEGLLAADAVNHYKGMPPRPGYYMHLYKAPDGRLLIADGHHRAAIAGVRGEKEIEAQIADDADLATPAQMAAALAMDRLGYGEVVAPAKVDTLRASECPVCGDSTSFNGEQCPVCGYIQPPDMFADPDLTKAQENDLRGEQQAAQPGLTGQPGEEAQPSTLACDNCGKEFDGQGDKPETAPDAAQPGAAVSPDPTRPERDETSLDPGHADPQPTNSKPKDDAVQEEKPGTEPGKPEDPEEKGDESKVELAHGDTCPACGDGTLKKKDPVDPEADAADDHEHANPFAKKDDGDDKDSEDDESSKDDDDSNKPPWLKKKKKSHLSKEHGVDMNDRTPSNPAQAARNALLARLSEQQTIIETQGRQIEAIRSTLVAVVGPGHPRVAHLLTAADEENNEVATTDEQALAPAAKDDVESVGAAPAPANTGVTPDAVTDVNTPNTTLSGEPFNNLVDVTAPVSGTDNVPKGDAAHVETDVRVGQPNNDTAFSMADGGWKSTSAKGDPQERFTASLRLARLRITAGTAQGEDLALAQGIVDSEESLDSIAAQTRTLEEVVAARGTTADEGPARVASRRLVPQSAQGVDRTVPSVATASTGGGVQPHASEGAVSSDEFNFLC